MKPFRKLDTLPALPENHLQEGILPVRSFFSPKQRRGLSCIRWPGIRRDATGQLEQSDQDSGGWVLFDSMRGVATLYELPADRAFSGAKGKGVRFG